MSPPRRSCRAPSRRTSSHAASSSADRRSSTRSCRRPAWSMTTSRAATVTRLASSSAKRHLTLRASRVGTARIGALFLDLAVALSDADRTFSTDGLLQHAALGGLGLGGEALDGLPSPFMLQYPAFLFFIMRQRISRQLSHLASPT